jgi:hypothetical protein
METRHRTRRSVVSGCGSGLNVALAHASALCAGDDQDTCRCVALCSVPGLQRCTARRADGAGESRRIDASVAVGAAGEGGVTSFEMEYRASL